MKSKHISLLTIGIFSLLLVSVSTQAVHVPSHVPSQNPQQPTTAQIAKFCQGYSKLKPTAQSKKKKQYDKYCKKSQLKPIVKKPVITRLAIKEKCAHLKEEIRVLGRDFGKQGSVQLRLKGVELPTKIQRWTPTEVRIVLNRKTKPGKRYQLSVKTANGSSNEKPLLLCKEKPPLPVSSKQAPSPKPPQIKPIVKTPLVVIPSQSGVSLVPLGKTDLLVNVTAPNKVTAGKSIPGLRVEAKNIGKIQAVGYKINLILSKDKRITKRPGLMKQSGTSLLQTISLTSPLAPKGRKDYFPAILLPANTAAGKYYLCAIIDPANKLKEYKENNNTQCTKLQVAAAKKGIPVLGQLGSKLRERVQMQPEQIPGLKPAKFEKLQKPVTPKNIQAAMLYTNSLTINGTPFGSVDVAEGATARVNWAFPRESGVQLVRLRIKSGRIGAGESTCPEPGTRGTAGIALMNGWDSGDLALPGRAQWYPNPTAATPDSSSGSLVLSPGGIYDLSQYTPGQEYSFVACGLSPVADGGFDFVHESNVVMMRYAGPGIAWWSGDLWFDLLFPRADLVVSDITRIRRGADTGKLLIMVNARVPFGGFTPPEDTFPYEVYVVPSRFAAELYEYGNLELGSTRGLGLGIDNGVQRYTGSGTIRNLLIFGYGDAIVTDFTVPETGSYTVFVAINYKSNPYRQFTRILESVGPGSFFYPESNYDNNTKVKVIGTGEPYNNVLDLTIEESGDLWAIARVDYSLSTSQDSILSLRVTGTEIPGYTGDLEPAPGEGPTLEQFRAKRPLTINCGALPGATRYAQAQRGSNRSARFLCRYTGTGAFISRRQGLTLLSRGIPRPDGSGVGVVELFQRGVAAEVWLGNSLSGIAAATRNLNAATVTRNLGDIPTRNLRDIASRNPGKKTFPFELDFVNSPGAVNLPPRMNFPSDRSATGRRQDYSQNGACWRAVGGSAWPSDLGTPAAGRVLAGHRVEYDPGANPFPCSSRWVHDAVGATHFDLSYFQTGDDAEALLSKATLNFYRYASPGPQTCTNNRPLLTAAANGWWLEAGNPFDSRRTGRRTGETGVSIPHMQLIGNTALPYVSGGGAGMSVDVTETVRSWIRNPELNNGFILSRIGNYGATSNSNCIGSYGSFELKLEFSP